MYSIKQIFLVLSLISLASAKKGVSTRKAVEVEAHRGLKKSSSSKKSGSSGGFVAPNRGGTGGIVGGSVSGGGGVNRDGTPAGTLLQPPGKPCVPFEDASKFLSAEYPGDAQCRTADAPMGATSACCRVFSFTDANGPQRWLLYDTNNQYRDLLCVCNANTGAASNPVISVPTGGDRGGAIAPPVASPISVPVSAPVVPPTPPGRSVCENPNPTQLDLQSRPGMTACVSSDTCGSGRCCSSNTCVCMPQSFLGNAYCA
ncbi:unnamed protein product [Cylindrotheca closterium]|uniref:Uncharacterized protein n=1 Tax=Cylindrotheca closterium TaxID=2856 RepID=A0AAD2FWQ2_9STRA|nr:unnamed protein product [Cylindrotheca closterium]